MIHPPVEKSDALTDLENIQHGFFGRRCGNDSEGLGLNTSETMGADPSRIAQNRRSALTTIGAGHMPLASLRQIHSNKVLVLNEIPPIEDRPQADAIVTNLSNLTLGILTADCVPILFCDSNSGVIGACHAGWKGAVGGIVNNTLAAMQSLGAQPETTIAAIGPAISGSNYEVGPEFAAQVIADNPATEEFIFKPEGKDREHFDVPGFVAQNLRTCGVQIIERIGSCTFANPKRYFSHRHTTQQGSTAGRQISLIAIK